MFPQCSVKDRVSRSKQRSKADKRITNVIVLIVTAEVCLSKRSYEVKRESTTAVVIIIIGIRKSSQFNG